MDSLDISRSSIGYDETGIKTVVEGIKTNLIEEAIKVLRNNVPALEENTKTYWKGSSRDAFADKIYKDTNTIIDCLTKIENFINSDVYQMMYNVNNSDATVAADIFGEIVSDESAGFKPEEIVANLIDYNPIYQAADIITNTVNNIDFTSVKTFGENALNVMERTGATLSTVGMGLVEGIGLFGEAIVDTGAILTAAGGTLECGVIDAGQAIYGAVTGKEWESVTKKLWSDSMGFVAKEHVRSAFNDFYDDTSIGQTLKNYSYGFNLTRGVSSGVGYTVGVIAASIFTMGIGGAGAAAGGAAGAGASAATSSLSAFMGGTAAVAGFGKGAEKAWSEGANLAEGLFHATGTAAWEGVQFFLGGKINGLNPFKSEFANAGARIALDTVDGGAEGFVQPLLDKIYKDKSYGELFDEAGGWSNVGIQASLGGLMSSLGEASGLAKAFRNVDDAKVDTSAVGGAMAAPSFLKKLFGKNNKVPTMQEIEAMENDYFSRVASAPYRVVRDGVSFNGSSYESLNRLMNYFDEVKARSGKSTDLIFKRLSEEGIVFTDITNQDPGISFSWAHTIYFSPETMKTGNVGTFFHEVGHYLDVCRKKNDAASSFSAIVTDLKQSYNSGSMNEGFNRFTNDFYNSYHAAYNNIDPCAKTSILMELEKNPDFMKQLPEIRESILNNRYKEYVAREVSNNPEFRNMNAVSDIMDALTEGMVADNFRYTGHGGKYYSGNIESQYKEVIANVSDLYNNGGINVLDRYIPLENRQALVGAYETMIGVTDSRVALKAASDSMPGKLDQLNDQLISYIKTGDINNVSPQARNVVEGLGTVEISKYLSSYSTARDMLDRASQIMDTKYGEGVFKNTLENYLGNYNITTFTRDGGVRDYISLLTPDQIMLYLKGRL